MAQINFNAASVDTTTRDPVPSGTYEAVVTGSEIRATKNGLGKGINFTFEILSEGPAKGRKVFSWINWEHPNPEAQRIGQEELARLCKAAGVENLTDTEQLHDIPIVITVGKDRSDPSKTAIKGFSPKARAAAAAAAKATSGGSGAAPWSR